MPGTYTNAGADSVFKGGLVGDGVELALFTASPPVLTGGAGANEITQSWYSRQAVAEAGFTTSTVSGYRRLTNAAAVDFGTVPSSGTGGETPACVAIIKGSVIRWFDSDVAFANFGINRLVRIAAGALRIDQELVGEEIT